MSHDGWHDPELDSQLNQYSGPEDETNTQFIYRTYNGLCDRICKPKRKNYTTADVEFKTTQTMAIYHKSRQSTKNASANFDSSKSQEEDDEGANENSSNTEEDDFSIFENDLTVPQFDVNTIHSIFWLNNKIPTGKAEHCLFYLHTNTRSAMEAPELLPVCLEAGFHLLAIDLPGHGRTFTHNDLISSQLSLAAVDVHIGHIKSLFQIPYFILLGRGLATALGIEYCSLQQRNSTEKSGIIRSLSRGLLKKSCSGDKLPGLKSSGASSDRLNQFAAKTDTDYSNRGSYGANDKPVTQSHPQPQTVTSINNSASNGGGSSSSIFSFFGFGSSTPALVKSSSSVTPASDTVQGLSDLGIDESILANTSVSVTVPASVHNPYTCIHMRSVVALILDTPYTSVNALVDDAVTRMQAEGYYIPKFLLDLGAKLVRSSVSARLGFDPYTVKPIELISHVQLPILILAALNDDYIPIHHAMEIHKICRSLKHTEASTSHYNSNAYVTSSTLTTTTPYQDGCSIVLFEGSHNSARPEAVHESIRMFMVRHRQER